MRCVMLLLLLLLTAAGRARVDGALDETVLRRLAASPAFFSFQPLEPTAATMSITTTITDSSECQCRSSCASDLTCLGYGYSAGSGTCQLSDVLPTPQRLLQAGGGGAGDLWQWHARGGARRLAEPCARDADCWLLTPGAVCAAGVCSCREHYLPSADGDSCTKTGEWLAVGSGRLSGQPAAEAAAADVDQCKQLCADNATCVSCDFSPAAGRCRLYAEGIVSDAGSGGGEESFVWVFARPDGAAPADARLVDGAHVFQASAVTGQQAAAACAARDAILYPGVSRAQLDALAAVWPELFTSAGSSFFGLDDMLVEDTFVASDGDDVPVPAWADGEPNNLGPSGSENCVASARTSVGLNDVECSNVKPPLCRYVGHNLAVGRPVWMNMPDPAAPAAYGNDGDVLTAATQSLAAGPALTWTVDLGGPVQVTGVLYLSGASGFTHADTEVRVGSSPVLFDATSSARCVLRAPPFVAPGYGRMLRCTEPLTGRYVRLIRHKPQLTLDLAELGVFGNRLEAPEGGCPACQQH